MIVEMPQVEEKELEAILSGHDAISHRWTRSQCALTATRKLTTISQEMSRDGQICPLSDHPPWERE
jgi:predicted DNA-binding transcriptional regulator YafY